MKKKAFTLIELIAVLVILAILVLIVTPLVMNIIRKARVAADRRSIDAYGRSVELAIANYLLDNGDFPDSISDLTIEYSGDQVVCSTTQLNGDSSVYLSGCTVGGRSVDYTYGKEETVTYDAYEVGDQVTYNNVDYYVIADSNQNDSTVTLLKAEPITSNEISPYLSSTEVADKVDTSRTYAKMAYYSAEDCVSAGDVSGCSTNYEVSDVKQVVDIWKTHYASEANQARLITYQELNDNLGYDHASLEASWLNVNSEYTPNWVCNNNYEYWTMSSIGDYTYRVWDVQAAGRLCEYDVCHPGVAVRPVITIKKSALN